ncbi:MAG: RhuM family protein [Wolbachia endosymbiont of Tyrophagus putrescentiae]|nr:RhuM family protein [Wolbachia endosymbiont of Tyrophagus putrescentiae]
MDAIIAIGYRVNSKKAARFRIWATNVLKEFIIKGFALERRFYQKIKDIYAECSTDYYFNSEATPCKGTK